MEASATFHNIDPDKQRRVLGEAQREFADKGFQGASMNRLSARLGIAKGSLFKYFGSKERLFGAVFSGAVESFAGYLRQARRETTGLPLDQRLERLLVVGTDFVRSHPHIYRIYLKMLFNEDVPLRGVFLTRVRALSSKFLTPIVTEAMRAGELPPTLDPALAVFLLDAVLDRFVQAQAQGFMDTGLGLTLDDARASRRTAATLARILAAGLRHAEPHQEPHGEPHA